tara:strand:+ start:496 stop:648 length:153 start_codon:yes stop_codon:yes gene_type:complete
MHEISIIIKSVDAILMPWMRRLVGANQPRAVRRGFELWFGFCSVGFELVV